PPPNTPSTSPPPPTPAPTPPATYSSKRLETRRHNDVRQLLILFREHHERKPRPRLSRRYLPRPRRRHHRLSPPRFWPPRTNRRPLRRTPPDHCPLHHPLRAPPAHRHRNGHRHHRSLPCHGRHALGRRHDLH